MLLPWHIVIITIIHHIDIIIVIFMARKQFITATNMVEIIMDFVIIMATMYTNTISTIITRGTVILIT